MGLGPPDFANERGARALKNVRTRPDNRHAHPSLSGSGAVELTSACLGHEGGIAASGRGVDTHMAFEQQAAGIVRRSQQGN